MRLRRERGKGRNAAVSFGGSEAYLVNFNRGQSLAFWTLGVGIKDGGHFFAIVVRVVLLFRVDGRLCAIILATRLAAAFWERETSLLSLWFLTRKTHFRGK